MSDEKKFTPPAPPGRPRAAVAAPAAEKPANEEPKVNENLPDENVDPQNDAPPTGPRLSEEPEPDSAKANPGPGNPFESLDAMEPGYYRKERAGRIRNPRTGLVYTNTTATQVFEPDSWDQSQLQAGVIAKAPGGNRRI